MSKLSLVVTLADCEVSGDEIVTHNLGSDWLGSTTLIGADSLVKAVLIVVH
jgi:hypothetical protein